MAKREFRKNKKKNNKFIKNKPKNKWVKNEENNSEDKFRIKQVQSPQYLEDEFDRIKNCKKYFKALKYLENFQKNKELWKFMVN